MPLAASDTVAIHVPTNLRYAVAAARDEGRRVAKPMGRGPAPIIRDETAATLCRLLAVDHHLTLAECRDRLAAETGVRVNPWTIGRALRRLDWT